MLWTLSHRFDPIGARLADRHYSRRTIGSPQFAPPGELIVLLTPDGRAVWTTVWQEFVKHEWPGAWMNSLFRNEAPDRYLSSELIRDAVAATRAKFGDPPAEGMITFVDADKVRHKRDPGRCYLRAGFRRLPQLTKSGQIVFQMLPDDMPPAEAAGGTNGELEL
jgi:hypothetical protein